MRLAVAASSAGPAYAHLSTEALQELSSTAPEELPASLNVDLLTLLTCNKQRRGSRGRSSTAAERGLQPLLHTCLRAMTWQAPMLQPSQLQPVLHAIQQMNGADVSALVAPLSLQVGC